MGCPRRLGVGQRLAVLALTRRTWVVGGVGEEGADPG